MVAVKRRRQSLAGLNPHWSNQVHTIYPRLYDLGHEDHDINIYYIMFKYIYSYILGCPSTNQINYLVHYCTTIRVQSSNGVSRNYGNYRYSNFFGSAPGR